MTALAVIAHRLAPSSTIIATSLNSILAGSLSLSAVIALVDFHASQDRRMRIATINDTLSVIQPPSLTFGYVPLFYFQVGRDNAFIGKHDPEVIVNAISKGYATNMLDRNVADAQRLAPRLSPADEGFQTSEGRLVRMKLQDLP